MQEVTEGFITRSLRSPLRTEEPFVQKRSTQGALQFGRGAYKTEQVKFCGLWWWCVRACVFN